jgi:hypothetical protein
VAAGGLLLLLLVVVAVGVAAAQLWLPAQGFSAARVACWRGELCCAVACWGWLGGVLHRLVMAPAPGHISSGSSSSRRVHVMQPSKQS